MKKENQVTARIRKCPPKVACLTFGGHFKFKLSPHYWEIKNLCPNQNKSFRQYPTENWNTPFFVLTPK